MTHRKRHKEACQKAFEHFEPDVSAARHPETILTIASLAAQGLYSAEIAERIGKSPKAVQKAFRRYGFPSLQNIEPPLQSERPNWSGGEKLMKGYTYRRTPGHPNGTKHGNYVAAHRLVMEGVLGRYLLKTEVVDHIDGDIQNNSPENLRVFQSNADHLKATLSGKVPNWTEDGKRRISEAVRLNNSQRANRTTSSNPQ